MSPDVTAWLASASADAKARQMPQLEPLLESLAKSLQALRDADAEFQHPASSFALPASGAQPVHDA